ncbi:MAG TPA: ABC transporter ATP-binding protein [Frankiaceae bacterium]|nr:ABC transporter ATP-binding protein [Frankiaceae bacterium]
MNRWCGLRALLRETRPLLNGFRILARTMPRIDRGRSAALVLSAVAAAGAQVAIGVTTGTLIGRVAKDPSVSGVTLGLVLALPALLLLLQVGQLAGVSLGQVLKRKIDHDLRRRVMRLSTSPAGISHLEDPELLKLYGAARNLSPFTFTPGDAAVQLPAGLIVRLQPLFAAAVLAWFEPLLALAAILVWALAQLLFVVITIRLVMGAATSNAPPDLVYLRDLVQEPNAAKEVRVFGLAPWLSGRYRLRTNERIAQSLQMRRGHNWSYLRGGAALGVGLAGSLSWIGVRYADHALSTGAAAICVFAALNIFFVPGLLPDVPVMFGVFAVDAVATAEKAVRPGLSVNACSSAPPVDTCVRLRDVTFSYPGSQTQVLSGLNLEIPAGQRLAIVGLNGAGKTTLVKLLCRLYDPDGGAIEVDGISLRDMEPAEWRSRVGVLFQDFIHFRLPAQDNVRLRPHPARVDETELPAAVEDAAKRAGVTDLIEALPLGWQTPLHASARGGVDLSGGQWQRLALARALHAVESGAGLLILDEPTANLDPRAELTFFDSVLNQELAPGRSLTTILISHRFATVRHADRIVVLENGQVTQDGTHDELMQLAGAYRTLFESQAKAFFEASHD